MTNSTKANIEEKYVGSGFLFFFKSVNRISWLTLINHINGKCVVLKHDHTLSLEAKRSQGL